MLNDNQAVATNSSIPAKLLGYYWIDGNKNPENIVSKYWSYPQVCHLFYSGDTKDLINPDEK
jgi:hypothetical protein